MKPRHLLMTADALGGVWTYALELAAALRSAEIHITLAMMGGNLTAAQRSEAESVGNLSVVESTRRLEWMDDPWSDVDADGEWLLALADEIQPDVIHLNGYAHAALDWPAPVLVVAHSCVASWWQAVKGEALPARYAEYRARVERGLASADLVVAPTAAMLAALGDHYHFATARRVIPNGRSAARFSAGKKDDRIFSAGRFWDEAKNVRLLEQIAPSLAWPVVLAGEGFAPSSDASAVRYRGMLPPHELAEQLAQASIYAAPARYEPFGLGILEAALSGCALVLADIPSLRELWSGAAVFVPPADEEAWITTLNQLAGDAARREQLAARARSRARQFSPEAMASAYLHLYEELLGTSAAVPEGALCV